MKLRLSQALTFLVLTIAFMQATGLVAFATHKVP
jgi:hypothetical protein